MKKKTVLGVFAILFCIFASATPTSALTTSSDFDISKDLVIQEAPEILIHDSGGYIPISSDFEVSVVKTTISDVPRVYVPDGFSTSALQYSGIDFLPGIRNQGDYNTCWAFSTVGLAEADLIAKGVSTSSIDFSELHLSYFAYHNVTDPLGGLEGDKNTYLLTNAKDSFLNKGGNYALSTYTLMNWYGLTDESKVPYTKSDEIRLLGLPDSLAYADNAAHLKNQYAINLKENPELAKQMILNHGGAAVYYYSSYYYDKILSCYNDEHACYYSDPSLYTSPGESAESYGNHAVMIVGWDDTFSRNNFNTSNRPSRDGAWLIRNSWGATEEDYDLCSYFWMSYEEPSLSTIAYIMDFVTPGDSCYYDNNYQYDGTILSGGFSVGSSFVASNMFTAGADPSGELLKAVSILADDANLSYTVSIYINCTDTSNPTVGQLAYTQSGTLLYEGYQTIPLSRSVRIAPGSKYSVVIELSGSKDRLYLQTDYINPSKATSVTYPEWFSTSSSAKAGQSFLFSKGVWHDIGAIYNVNARIKAYTNNIATSSAEEIAGAITYYKISYELNGGTQNEQNPGEYLSFTNIPLYAPVKAGYQFTGWYLDASCTVPIQSITSSMSGDLALYAGWSPIHYSILFDGNGADSGAVQTLAGISYDQAFRLPANGFSRIGYQFIGWNTCPDGTGIAYTDLSELSNLTTTDQATITLYAQWSLSIPDVGFVFTDPASSIRYTVVSNNISAPTVKCQGIDQNVKTLSIPDTVLLYGMQYRVVGIADGAFKNNKSLTKVVIGNNVTSIGKKAFYHCTKLKNVQIGSAVKNIGANAFAQCNKIKKIVIQSKKLTAKSLNQKAFKGINKSTTIYVPKKKFSTYKTLLRKKGLSTKVKLKKIS